MIGVGVTTRNRTIVFRTSMYYMAKYLSSGSVLVVCDDNSNSDAKDENKRLIDKLAVARPDVKVIYHYNETRLGIAPSKNRCLYEMKNAGCKNFFLFDDDCWPRNEGWDDLFIKCGEANNIHHFMYICTSPRHAPYFRPVGKVGSGETEITAYCNCSGMLLYFDETALSAVGGYDLRFDIYGFEHAQLSSRLHRAGINGSFVYMCPTPATEYIYSHDEWRTELVDEEGNVIPDPGDIAGVARSLSNEEIGEHIQHNHQFMVNPPIYIPLEVR